MKTFVKLYGSFSVEAHCQNQEHSEEKNSPGNWTQRWDRLPIKMIQSWTRKSFPINIWPWLCWGVYTYLHSVTGSFDCFYRLIFVFWAVLFLRRSPAFCTRASTWHSATYLTKLDISTDRKAILAPIQNKLPEVSQVSSCLFSSFKCKITFFPDDLEEDNGEKRSEKGWVCP